MFLRGCTPAASSPSSLASEGEAGVHGLSRVLALLVSLTMSDDDHSVVSLLEVLRPRGAPPLKQAHDALLTRVHARLRPLEREGVSETVFTNNRTKSFPFVLLPVVLARSLARSLGTP